ncbi:histidinol phosphatase [Clostridium botulinum]|uniref:Histidinol-phosphatase n=4 Tax=Clostridium botulinum TaxID=1491 RepID=A0A0A0IEU6_CLOBO|nr:histidinol phosphate phosphatase [Clostridium botulinum]KEI00242.1 histidinol phosphatase [Clostridium botulinum C/D str. BKT75002]KEI07021.1 histidinol phosphatase [Clostridium botulinum C/D str. BKT2873]KGM94940.1 histidinol phosphatase [Clostridium botulinum D str. CCUG 7971]KGM99048.1 histidinol phosphatase [Clostridium botulinum C/D str. DC5]KOC47356.1 histidinol phosphatase [Clostridium botulinum]
MFDTHMHTKYSTDSHMTIDEVINKISEYNIGAIITEHMDLNYHNKEEFRLDSDKYFDDYYKYRNDKLLLGIEIGMCNEYCSNYENIVNEYPFDYIIGSVHEIEDEDLYVSEKIYKNNSKDELYIKYFEEIIKRINKHRFINSLGHIDYIARCAKYDDREIYYNNYREHIDDVLLNLIDKDICLELNTRRLEDKKAINNIIKIYNRFSQLGGKFITIGSDAHNKNSIASYFKEATELAEFCGLRPVYFKNRKIKLL